MTASWFFRKDLGPDDGVTMLRGHLEANRPYARCQEMLEAAHGERELAAEALAAVAAKATELRDVARRRIAFAATDSQRNFWTGRAPSRRSENLR